MATFRLNYVKIAHLFSVKNKMFLIDSHIFFFLASFLNTKPDLKNLHLIRKEQEESNHYEEEMASY